MVGFFVESSLILIYFIFS